MNDIFGDKYLQGIREGDGIPDGMDLDGSIEFPKENWSGELGKIFIDGDTFTIEGIGGTFTLEFNERAPIIIDQNKVEYYGFVDEWKGNTTYTFIRSSITRKDSHPQVAFAKLMYNL